MTSRVRVLGVIPARLNSTRLPRKVLRLICGKPMVQHVYERARLCRALDQLVVATDADEVAAACRRAAIPVEMTSPHHASGSDRLFEVMGRRDAEIIVNIQGDEPLLEPSHVDSLLRPFDQPDVQVSTLRVAIDAAEAQNPNAVKVVCDAAGRALYFSRSVVPYDRDASGDIQYFKHLGFYAYRRDALQLFHRLPPSRLEQAERLEQLRFLENGVAIHVADAPVATVGVDTEDDLRRVEEILRQRLAA
jgi:3-deoxy-manno-octulosonate cytidylyltransferase (CMP-KDO synthetase)